ncbi:MAG: GlsB/YeaQ/YmgE family stress response membrane protein [Bdellovibrionota bacterium]
MIWVLLVGLVVGAVAKFFLPGKDPGGIFITMLLGVAGSMLANWIGRSAGFYAEGDVAGFISSVIGAMILLVVYRMFTSRRS